MALVTVTCPHCGFFKRVEEFFLPCDGTEFICESCKSSYLFEGKHIKYSVIKNTTTINKSKQRVINNDISPTESGFTLPKLGPAKTSTFEFTGNAKEYFGIWIVNTLLRIITLGIYSPWAKVRRRHYFYGNTLLDGESFGYLANPLSILKGWLIAVFFIALYSLLSKVNHVLSSVLMVTFAVIYPWVLVRSRIFNCANATYRNIRFSFAPKYSKAYMDFFWLPLLTGLSMGLLTPYMLYCQRRFLVENTSYGGTPFEFSARLKDYYKVFIPLLIVIPILVIGLIVVASTTKASDLSNHTPEFFPILLLVTIYFFTLVYIPTVTSNVTWSATSIKGNKFSLSLRVRDVTWIYISNAVAIIFSLGLLAPWGRIRLARYRFERFTVTGNGMDTITAGSEALVGAAGEELGDLMGFDFGI